jgi:hypothetical protein
MKLYVDDIRPAPESWMQARNVTDAIKTIARFGHEITEISLDHDISLSVIVDGTQRPFPSDETFQAVAHYIIAYWAIAPLMPKPKITIHTANPVGGKELELLLKENGFETTINPASRVNRLESEV